MLLITKKIEDSYKEDMNWRSMQASIGYAHFSFFDCQACIATVTTGGTYYLHKLIYYFKSYLTMAMKSQN